MRPTAQAVSAGNPANNIDAVTKEMATHEEKSRRRSSRSAAHNSHGK
jgi:hypothetical protein